MSVNWDSVLARLQSYPEHVHVTLPPCPYERIMAVEKQLGALPDSTRDMLGHFNGAELFNRTGPLVTMFGISLVPALPAFEWAPDWYIDKFTEIWRSGRNEGDDWALAMMNYGGVVLLDATGTTKEWDSATKMWSPERKSLDEWIEDIFREGDAFLRD